MKAALFLILGCLTLSAKEHQHKHMALLTDKLVAYWALENNAPPYTQADYSRHSNLLARNGITSVAGVVHNAVSLDPDKLQYLAGLDNEFLRIPAGRPWTMAFWIKFNRLTISDQIYYLVAKKGNGGFGFFLWVGYPVDHWKWHTQIDVGASLLSGNVSCNVEHPALTTGQWYFVVWDWDGTARSTLTINNDPTLRGEDAFNHPPDSTVGGELRFGSLVDWASPSSYPPVYIPPAVFDEIGIWWRLLDADDRALLMSGVTPLTTPAAECDPVDCCVEPLAPYNASEPSPSDAYNTSGGVVPVDNCSPVPTVTIFPPTGTIIGIPASCTLTASRPDAVIYYTTDGTIPTTSSTLYTGPFTITSTAMVVSAIAKVQDCDPGPVAVASWVLGDVAISLLYRCDEPDLVGRYGVFAPADGPDYHWRLLLHVDTGVNITRFEMYRTDGAGNWTTGEAWSTDEFITPDGGPPNFHAYPLELWTGCDAVTYPTACGAQLYITYQPDLGLWDGGDYIIDMYGQPPTVTIAPSFFKFKVILTDGRVLWASVTDDCNPPPCVHTVELGLTMCCTGIIVSMLELTPALPYRIERKVNAGGGCVGSDWSLWKSGTTDGTQKDYLDTDTLPTCTYCYRIFITFPDCPDIEFVSPTKCGSPLCQAQVSLTAAWVDGICNSKVRLTYCAQCVSSVTIEDDQGSGPIAGIGPCDCSTPCHKDVDWIWGPNAVVTWTITGIKLNTDACGQGGANTCTDAVDTATMQSLPPACSGLDAGVNAYQISGFNPVFDMTQCGIGVPNNTLPVWNGQFVRSALNPCSWGLSFAQAAKDSAFGTLYNLTECSVAYDPNNLVWSVDIRSGNMQIWTGTKACGDTPDAGGGVYLKTGGCYPATSVTISPVA